MFKWQHLILSIGVIIFSNSVNASNYIQHYTLESCLPEHLIVTIKNLSPQTEAFWFQTQHPLFKEQRELIKAKTQLEIPGDLFLKNAEVFAIKTFSSKLEFSFQCQGRLLPSAQKTGTHFIYSPPQVQAKSTAIVFALNLFPDKNPITVTSRDRSGKVLAETVLTFDKYFESKKSKIPLSAGTFIVEIKGSQRFALQIQNETETPQKITSVGPSSLKPNDLQKHFLVSRKESFEESFVIATADPETIRLAREQIENPTLEKILVATIEVGHNQTNRDFSQKLSPLYSWHVQHIDAFADFAHIDCDGSPQLTEERIMERLLEKAGRICFWSYRIVRELTSEEVKTGKLLSPLRTVPASPRH